MHLSVYRRNVNKKAYQLKYQSIDLKKRLLQLVSDYVYYTNQSLWDKVSERTTEARDACACGGSRRWSGGAAAGGAGERRGRSGHLIPALILMIRLLVSSR